MVLILDLLLVLGLEEKYHIVGVQHLWNVLSFLESLVKPEVQEIIDHKSLVSQFVIRESDISTQDLALNFLVVTLEHLALLP